MYYLLAIYLIMLPIFFVVMYVDVTRCTTTKLTINDLGVTILLTLCWPAAIWVTKEFWPQVWWTFQLRRGKLLQSKENSKTIIHYTKGNIYYWKTRITRATIRGVQWKIYHPITFKEL